MLRVDETFKLPGEKIFDLGRGGCGTVSLIKYPDFLVTRKRLSYQNIGKKSKKRYLKDKSLAYNNFSFFGFVHNINLWLINDVILYIDMDFIPGGSLDTILKAIKNGKQQEMQFTITNYFIIFYGIARILSLMHSKNCIHRDLKTHNILIDMNMYPYLADYSFTLRNNENVGNNNFVSDVGMLPYCAPENLTNEITITNDKTDVYSVGIVFYEILYLDSPYEGIPPNETKNYIMNGKLPNEVIKTRVLYSLPFLLGDIWKQCCRKEPEKRPTAVELYQMIYQKASTNYNVNMNMLNEYVKWFDNPYKEANHTTFEDLKQAATRLPLAAYIMNLNGKNNSKYYYPLAEIIGYRGISSYKEAEDSSESSSDYTDFINSSESSDSNEKIEKN